MTLPWIFLIAAGGCEVVFTTCLAKAKNAVGMEWWFWMALFLLALILSMELLIRATATIPLGTAYAVWTGIGAVGTVLVGIVFFQESADFWRIFFILTLIGSIIGLKVLSH